MNNLQRAMKKFNRMYERVFTNTVSTGELSAIKNYGENMMKLYNNGSLFKETASQVRALSNMINQRNNEEL